jgi:hypothetical protein
VGRVQDAHFLRARPLDRRASGPYTETSRPPRTTRRGRAFSLVRLEQVPCVPCALRWGRIRLTVKTHYRGPVHCSVWLCRNTDGPVGPFLYPRLGLLERLRIADVAPVTVAERVKQKTVLNEAANLLPLRDVRCPRRLELAMHPRRRLSAQGTGPRRERIQGSLERSPAITADEREQAAGIGWYASLRHNL